MEFCSDQVYIAVSYYLRVITQHTRLQGARINGFLSMGSSFLVCDLPHRLLTHTQILIYSLFQIKFLQIPHLLFLKRKNEPRR